MRFAIPMLLPLFIAVAVAEMIGTEVAQGTLAPLLLRPVDPAGRSVPAPITVTEPSPAPSPRSRSAATAS